MFKLAAAYRSKVFPIKSSGGRILELIYSGRVRCYETSTSSSKLGDDHQKAAAHHAGVLKVGTATTHYFESEEFKAKQTATNSFPCSPREVISCPDHNQTTYCHFLLGLFYSKQVEFVTSTFAYAIVQAFHHLIHNKLWKHMCEDLRTGTPNPHIVTDPSLRKAESMALEMDWYGVIPALWPNAKYVYSIMTGSMLPYKNKLKHYAGHLPLISADYGASECWVGVNIDPRTPPEMVTFTIVPTFAYFEFLPLTRRKLLLHPGGGSHKMITTDDDDDDDDDICSILEFRKRHAF